MSWAPCLACKTLLKVPAERICCAATDPYLIDRAFAASALTELQVSRCNAAAA